jgi:hypothetical protein
MPGGYRDIRAISSFKGKQSEEATMEAMRKTVEKRAANDRHPEVRHVDSGLDVLRKSFERWAANEGHPLVRHADGSYAYSEVERDWHIWRAAIMFQGTHH